MQNESRVDVPDSIRPYLNAIAERLWAERAAVMVGSGFSKNAGNEFPDWNQLSDLFYEKTHGHMPDPAKQKYLNVMQLAEEVHATFDRPALENLLHSNIPDLNIEPSGLHVELLELPWVDVFTTNYDTLLERASDKVVTRRYDPVVNKEDIPYAIKPRIVKLHGSFPSERPFIITEEDYRRYPHDYAPFVNTVQQALLENTFCLIGFSGDDPNFLQWTGWIRDNLGKDKTQKIYLIGVFDLSPARLQFLGQRGITVVDLSCWDGIEKQHHKEALSRFFEYIRSKKPDVLDWPHTPKTTDMPLGAVGNEEIQNIMKEWRGQRQNYLGWLIMPHDKRENLWASTDYWIDYLPDTEKSPPGLDIQYAFELIWRLERCLMPVFNNIAEFCKKLLEKYWPFQNENPPTTCRILPGENEFQDLPWDELRQAWLAIALAMLRFYREEGNIEKWKEAKKQLKTLSHHFSAEQKEFLNYEGFLFCLFTLDLPKAKERLENWRPNEAQPYWMAKRAAALAEIGLLSEAETMARDALENIRKKLNQKVGVVDLTLVSLESNAMLLGEYIQDAAALEWGEWRTLQDKRTQFNDRWNELKGFKCDPLNEINLFKLTLKNPPIQRETVTTKREFDIGRPYRTYHSRRIDPERLSAYAFLRFGEEVGLPYRVGNYGMAKETALASLQSISQHSSFWAIATLTRLGEEKAVDGVFNREAVYRITAHEADQLIDGYLEALNKCRDDILMSDVHRNNSYGGRLAKLLPEFMSRLCCKCSIEAKHRILEFVTGIYALPDKTHYRNVGNLLRRLISSMSEMEQYNLVPDLLKIPFPENSSVEDELLNPFRLSRLMEKPECAPALEIQTGVLNHLFQQAALDNSNRRPWAITSLFILHRLELLNDSQSQNLAELIWRVRDQYGLPDNTGFYKFVFLRFLHPEDVDPAQLLKKYVKSTIFPTEENLSFVEEAIGANSNGGSIWTAKDAAEILEHLPKWWDAYMHKFVEEAIGVNSNGGSIRTAKDAAEILERLLKWWDADKHKLDEMNSFSSIVKEGRERLVRIVELLAEVVGPKLSTDSSDKIKTSLNRLLQEIREYGLPGLAAEAACLHLYPEQKAEVSSRINDALISNQSSIQEDGLKAITNIILDGKHPTASSLQADLASMLSQCLTWFPTHSISSALGSIVRILRDSPSSFSGSLEVDTQRRLDRLLGETAYNGQNPDLNFDQKLEARRASSILASTLWSYYSSRSLPIPKVLEKWRAACQSSDEFSEVRNAWNDCP